MDLEVVETLLTLPDPFWLLLLGIDPGSRHAHNLLHVFVEAQQLQFPVVELVVEDNTIASALRVALVPQLRLYANGKEIRRLRGTPDSKTINELWYYSFKV